TVGGAEHEDGRALGAHEVAREAAAGRDLAAGGKVAEDALGEGRDLGLGREDGAQAREQRMEPPLERAVPVADVPRLDEGPHAAGITRVPATAPNHSPRLGATTRFTLPSGSGRRSGSTTRA